MIRPARSDPIGSMPILRLTKPEDTSLCHSSIAARLPRTHELLYDDPKVICAPKRFSFSFDRNAEPAQRTSRRGGLSL